MTTTNLSWEERDSAPRSTLAEQTIVSEVLVMEATRSEFAERLNGILGGGPGPQAWLDLSGRTGHRLPRLSLVEVDGAYYMQDGHHRLFVANALGDGDIEANVVAWL